MTAYIGCIGLLGIIAFIAFLSIRRKTIDGAMGDFYKENLLYTTEDFPPDVRESLTNSDNIYCCRANLILATGANVEFCWWEWNIKSTTVVNNVASSSYDYYLAVSFAPQTVSDEFMKKATDWADKSTVAASQKLKDFFVLNTERPYRAEKIADGNFLMCWKVLKRRDVYDAKINWLKNNVSIFVTPELAKLEELHALLPHEPEIVTPQIIEPVSAETETTGVIFYKNDNYSALRYTFNTAWPNLELELHHNSSKFDKEGYDELESDANLADPNSPNRAVFTLTDETLAGAAEKLFEGNFGVRAVILRDGLSIESRESLAYCNNPFRLPLNAYTYGEFKRRFTEHWSNLSIELYDTSPHDGGLWRNERELADDFEMKNLKKADKAFLHDYIYISDWGKMLKNVQVAAAIKNKTLGIYAEGNFKDERLKDFQALEKT